MCLRGAWITCFASGALWMVCPQTRAQRNPDLTRAVQERPNDSRLQNAYAIALQQQGRFEESLEHFRKALQLDPKYTDAAQNLALALLTRDRPAEALGILDKHPSSKADHYAVRGAVLNALGRSSDALPAFRRAYELAPNSQDYAYDFAIALLKLEQSEEASRLLRKALDRFPKSAKIHAAAGVLAYHNGQNVEAAKEYVTATNLEPGAADLWAALGDVYAATDNSQQAEKAYSRAIHLAPASAEYRVKAGRNLLKLQRAAEAESAFQKAIEIDSSDAEAHFQLGKLAFAKGDNSAAILHYEHAVTSQPTFNAAWYQLSLSYRRGGQEEKAREALENFRKTQ
jgi:Flp pilus assembly protein TadD